MFVLFEDAGKFLAGRVLSESDSSACGFDGSAIASRTTKPATCGVSLCCTLFSTP